MFDSGLLLNHNQGMLKVLAGVIYLTAAVPMASPLPGNGMTPSPLRYVNTEYGFQIDLPESWRGYYILTGQWVATYPNGSQESGPKISLRQPSWTTTASREDMPIMVFTHDQWNKVQQEAFRVSAAPMPPAGLGENSKFVLALPPRYNFDELTGFEEVDKLVRSLVAFEPSTN
jgi:hypothetical protein